MLLAMSSINDLQVLKEEEKSLLAIATQLQDQLNRLKVEELALINQIREEHEQGEEESSVISDYIREEQNYSWPPSVASLTEESVEELDLSVGNMRREEEMDPDMDEEEEDDDDGEDRNDLTALIQQLHENNQTLGQY
ncbi:uncharacterized protein LOC141902670 [Tubulanus polymorphus]|uniref:uncharacterized protein LOC141902670 n=1 Tax=Tubulanus polymorphus TaxID=672921 RepID=UPI003DA31A8B